MFAGKKRRKSTNEARAPKQALAYTSIAPPKALQCLQDSIHNVEPNVRRPPRALACIDCLLSINNNCETPKRRSSTTLQQSFTEGVNSGCSATLEEAISKPSFGAGDQMQCELRLRPKPQRRKSVTWDPSIEDTDRTQGDLNDYRETAIGDVENLWWKDPTQLEACESLLKTGKYLDAFMALSSKDLKRIVGLLPQKIVKMVMSISSQVRTVENSALEEHEARNENSDYGLPRMADVDADIKGGNDNANDVPTIPSNHTREMAAHRRLLAEYFDSRFENRLFCRYSGRVKRAAPCPKSDIRKKGLVGTYEDTKGWGPTAHAVSLTTRSNRPFVSPIRFSQAYMAMKLHRLGKADVEQIEFLKDKDFTPLEEVNHYVCTEPFISEDRLLVRSQYWIYAESLDKPESKAYVHDFLNGYCVPDYRSNDQMTWACHHMDAEESEPCNYDFNHPEEAAKLRRCTECALEYQINTLKSIPVNWTTLSPRLIPKGGFCAVITVWRDFGRCLTPFDPRWAAHFVEYTMPSFTTRFPAHEQQLRDPAEEEPSNDWELGGIRRAYEKCDELVETERSLHISVLKAFLLTREEKEGFVEEDERREKLREIERQRRVEEEEERRRDLKGFEAEVSLEA